MWSSGGWSGDEPDPEFFRRLSPPENEIPVAVPLNAVLGRTEDAAIALTGLQVYTTGVSFDLAVRVRSWPDDDHRGLSELVFHPAGGGGGQLSVDQSPWLSPVPPEGSVRFDCSRAPWTSRRPRSNSTGRPWRGRSRRW